MRMRLRFSCTVITIFFLTHHSKSHMHQVNIRQCPLWRKKTVTRERKLSQKIGRRVLHVNIKFLMGFYMKCSSLRPFSLFSHTQLNFLMGFYDEKNWTRERENCLKNSSGASCILISNFVWVFTWKSQVWSLFPHSTYVLAGGDTFALPNNRYSLQISIAASRRLNLKALESKNIYHQSLNRSSWGH